MNGFSLVWKRGRLQRKVPPRTIHHAALRCLNKRLLTNAEHRTDLIKKPLFRLFWQGKELQLAPVGKSVKENGLCSWFLTMEEQRSTARTASSWQSNAQQTHAKYRWPQGTPCAGKRHLASCQGQGSSNRKVSRGWQHRLFAMNRRLRKFRDWAIFVPTAEVLISQVLSGGICT